MRPPVEELLTGIRSGNRAMLARAITLVEDRRASRHEDAQQLLRAVWPESGSALRIGMTGTPGVGKSTLIEALGMRLVEHGKHVAVLAVDPSSTVSGGSILGDKARMHRLAQHKHAYIRPSPTATTLGGVARRTLEAMVLCEAAGFDVVFIETVGVGQSEVTVADVVDTMVLLLLPGGGDELQGIKRGVLERANVVVVHKADGDRERAARESGDEIRAALRYARSDSPGNAPIVLEASASTGAGLDAVWQAITDHQAWLAQENRLATRRQQQLARLIHAAMNDELTARLAAYPPLTDELDSAAQSVMTGDALPFGAAKALLERWLRSRRD